MDVGRLLRVTSLTLAVAVTLLGAPAVTLDLVSESPAELLPILSLALSVSSFIARGNVGKWMSLLSISISTYLILA